MESGKGTNVQTPITGKLMILDCEKCPFEGKVSWQTDLAFPVIKDAILMTQQKEQNADSLKKIVRCSKLKPATNLETKYQQDYTKKDLPILSRFWLPKNHLLFSGSVLTTSKYENDYQGKYGRCARSGKREPTIFKDLDYKQDGKNKSAYMDDFPYRPPKRVFLLPPLPKRKQSARNGDPRSRKFETETTYLKDYIPFKIEGPNLQTVLRTVARGILPRLQSVRPDPNFKKSVTNEEQAAVAEKFPRTGRVPCRPKKDSILKFDGKAYFDTHYDGNYIDPAKKVWFHGHRLAWKPSHLPQIRPRRLPMISKVVGNPLTWRYV